MYLNILKLLFDIAGILFIILFSIRAFGKFDDLGKLSAFVSGIAMSLALYILIGIALTILFPSYINKLVILFFTISPFIIGKIVRYETLKLYSIIQILCVILSLGFINFIA